LAFIDEGLQRDPNFIEAYFLRFEVYSEMGDLTNAKAALKAGQKINPDFFPNAWFYLAAIEFSGGKYAEAQPHFRKFISYPRVNPEMIEASKKYILDCDFALYSMENPVDFNPIN